MRQQLEPSVYVQFGVAVRALELVTEALVTQGAARKPRQTAEPGGREILAAITNLADNYHGVHVELTKIREMLVEQAERRQHDNDARADRLAAEIDELRGELHQLRIEAKARLDDAEARLYALDGKGPAPVPVAVPVAVPLEGRRS